MNIGTIKNKLSTQFRVWAPLKKSVELHIISPEEKIIPMLKEDTGYWSLELENNTPAIDYFYRLDNERDRPDPVAFYQPEGVHGPSRVLNHSDFIWTDKNWQSIPSEKMIFYEIHTGTFTAQGTFEGIINRLDDLNELGINAIEIMPVSQFPGNRNWGYDGVYPFAVQNSYGGPLAFKKLINSCHAKGIAVVLDVVYNHLGPEGNYIWDFAPYFTDKYKTPWGWALNFDGEYSNEVRNYFIQNAIYWFEYFHIDALRLDAIHGIYDFSAKHILKDMAEKVSEFSIKQGRNFFLIAESDLNDTIIINDPKNNGFGIHCQWNDDFHHCIHTLITGEKSGYYNDFGNLADLEKCINEGFVYSGQYSTFRKRNHGNSAAHFQGNKFVVFSQNHDQTGNRMKGERLTSLTNIDGLKLAAGMTLLSPFLPLLFMGEEYGELSPFLYFISHEDKDLIEAVRNGRKKEFESFEWEKEPADPYDLNTFEQCILKWDVKKTANHAILYKFYKELIRLRKTIPVFSNYSRNSITTFLNKDKKTISIHRFEKGSEIFLIAHFGSDTDKLFIELPHGKWLKLLNSFDEHWLGKIQPLQIQSSNAYEVTLHGFGFILFEKKNSHE
ncbi:MAG: hypothetical protein ACD_79C00349G0002 [uncultured bacterium]|nr:MAG: hypothetical protein ACD_79C00349G0002 [uncultured bacterium]